MPAQALTFPAGDAQIVLSATGLIERVAHPAHGPGSYLRPHRALPKVITGGLPIAWQPAGVVIDEDEVETRYAADNRTGMECTIRNAFGGSWIQRQMLINTSAETIQIDDVITSSSPATGMVGQVHAGAGDAFVIVQPADGLGPLLAARLSHGSVFGHAPDGLRTGAIQLQPGRRFVLQWMIDFVPDAVGLARSLSAGAAAPVELWPGESYPIDDPDTAVLAAEPLTLEHENGIQTVGTDQAGRYAVELRSARGSRQVELAWAPHVEDVLAQRGQRWLAGETTGSEAPRLLGSGAALGVQHGLSARLIEDSRRAEEALSRHTARLLDQERLSGLDICFLAQEAVRSADPDPLDRARDELLSCSRPAMGLGMAATRVSMGQLAAGSVPTAVMDHLGRVRQQYPTGDGRAGVPSPVGAGASSPAGAGASSPVGAGAVLDEMAALELQLVLGPAGLAAAGMTDTDPAVQNLLPGVLRLAASLGSGLPGRRFAAAPEDDLSPAVRGYLAAVLDLVPEALGPLLARRCGQTPHELADRARATALADALWPLPAPSPSCQKLKAVFGSEFRTTQSRDEHLTQLIGWLVLGRPEQAF
jgi:hypothetical protein